MKILTALCALLVYSGYTLFPEATSKIRTDLSEENTYLNRQDTVTVFKSFEAKLNMLTKEEGGRQTPFFNNFEPSFKIGNIKVPGSIILPRAIQMIRPGDTRQVSVKLTSSVELKEGQQFEIFELDKKIGIGTVLKLKLVK